MRFGAYETEAEIGRGGMGVVYRGHAVSAPERVVAIKVLTGADDDALERFERERRLLASLTREDGFVPLLDAGEVAGRPYLVMPFLAGGTLEDRLERGPLAVAEAVALVRQLALAMQRAHERGIVHRDLKPANVLFGDHDHPLVGDLGLAKHFRRDLSGASQSRSLSTQGMTSGTVGYMAPEQLDDSKNVTPAADVFALGAILFECLAGSRPFVAASLLGYAKALQKEAVSVSAFRADAPPWLAEVVATALSIDPRERFADARAFARALEKPTAGARRALGASVVALAALVVAAGGAFALRPRPGIPPVPVEPLKKGEPPRPASAARVEELIREAKTKMGAKDFEGACALLDRAVELDPLNAEARGRRGMARAMRKDAAGALDDFSEAIRLEPGASGRWFDRGVLHQELHDSAEAIEDFSRAIALDPKNVMAVSNRANVRHEAGDVAGGMQDLDRAVALAPQLPMVWLNRGCARQEAGDVPGAVADLERWLELASPTDPDADKVRAWLAEVRPR